MKQINPTTMLIHQLSMKIHNLRQFIEFDENLWDIEAINKDLVKHKRQLRVLLGMDNKITKGVIKSL